MILLHSVGFGLVRLLRIFFFLVIIPKNKLHGVPLEGDGQYSYLNCNVYRGLWGIHWIGKWTIDCWMFWLGFGFGDRNFGVCIARF